MPGMRRRSEFDEEVNYWPSVSDMFLVFFILALCIVSTMTSNLNDGEKRIFDEVVYQSNELFSLLELDRRYDATMDSDTTDYPRLAEMLMIANEKLYTGRKLSKGGEVRANDNENISEAKYNYREAVKYLFRRVALEADLTCADNTDSARLLDMINRRLGGVGMLGRAQQSDQIMDSLTGAGELDVDSLLKELKELRDKQTHMVDVAELEKVKQQYDALQKEYDELLKKQPDMAELARLRAQLKELDNLKKLLVEYTGGSSQYQTALNNLKKLKEMLDAALAERDAAKKQLALVDANTHVSQVVLDGDTVRYYPNEPEPKEESIAMMFGSKNYNNNVIDEQHPEQSPVLLRKCDEVATALMKDAPAGMVIEIIGHTDGDSTTKGFNFSVSGGNSWSSGNAALGLQRARVMADMVTAQIRSLLAKKLSGTPTLKDNDDAYEKVRKYLMFRCYSAAECYPLAFGTSDEAKDKNRRIELLVRPMTDDEKKRNNLK